MIVNDYSFYYFVNYGSCCNAKCIMMMASYLNIGLGHELNAWRHKNERQKNSAWYVCNVYLTIE